MKTKTVIFADLDGTFLDDQYNYDETKYIVNHLKALGSSIVFCSSKTKKEIEFYRAATGINEPFISENGAAIFIPKNYFPFRFPCSNSSQYHIIRLGIPYNTLRTKLAKIKEQTAVNLIGFGDMSLEEIAYDTGLPLDLAKLAKKREHDEPFRILKGNKTHIFSAIKKEGLNCVEGGRYLHLNGGTDKGKAVTLLRNLYCQMFGKVKTLGVGDGPNDKPMLAVVDKSFFITKTSLNSRVKVWQGILRHVSRGY